MANPPSASSLLPANRLLPLIVAIALFMENMDSTIIATSLPAIAKDIGANPLALKLAITSYLLSLAIFIPASGWTADRFGTRTVFRAAIAIFMIGSIGCAVSSSLTDFVVARIVQGIGGAMMTPVGRLVLVRSFSKRDLVGAMAWLSTPALVGPMLGPPVGGFITTYASWHWIFLINIPIGLAGLVLVSRYFENVKADKPDRFDFTGMLLSGLGIGGVAFGFSVAGLNFLPWTVTAALIGGGAMFIVAYFFHAKRVREPAIDLTLFKIPTFRGSVVGGFIFRLGIGALAFLLPLMLQIGFGFSPFNSGLITFASAVGALTMKLGVSTILRRLGFRNVLIVNAVVSSVFLGVCAFFNATTPMAVMFAVLLIGGFFRSLEFTLINALAYADIEPARAGRATSLASVAQQLSVSTGVAVGALLVETSVRLKAEQTIAADDFFPAFIAIALISATSAFIFMRMPKDAGEEMANRLPAANEGGDQRL